MTDSYSLINNDTIASRATAPGIGSISVVRISGKLAYEIGQKITNKQLQPRKAHFGAFYDMHGKVIDEGISIFFPAPGSFTGENIVELQGHGGIVVDIILQVALHYGARQARAGEFSERAFLNGKIDLTQAEAIADLIDSASEQAARAAIQSLTGVFSTKINNIIESLISLRVFIEAAIDFPEEEIDFLADHPILEKIDQLVNELKDILATAKQGVMQRDGMKILIMGEPNVGKSSLMNILAGVDTSIVTDIKGTTRDIIKENIHLDGMPIQIVDTAGLRHTTDKVEKIGIQKTIDLTELADLILFMVDQELNLQQLQDKWYKLTKQEFPTKKIIIIKNKIDINNEEPKKYTINDLPAIALAAKYKQGIDLLITSLKQQTGFDAQTGGCFSARQRHINSLNKALNILITSKNNFAYTGAAELLAEDLRQVQNNLGEITGRFSNEQLLGRIFADFCIGK